MNLDSIIAKISTDLDRPLQNLTTEEIMYLRDFKSRRKGNWYNHYAWTFTLELLRREGRVF